jgi:hypothetical protein
VALFTCPVCGWAGLREQAVEPFGTHEICACCGTQFGLDVMDASHVVQARVKWLERGAPWYYESPTVYPAKPAGWSRAMAEQQIRRNLSEDEGKRS